MPTINKRFLLESVLVVLAFAGLLVGVHTVQAGRIPEALKRQAERAAEAGKFDIAIHYFRQYLEFEPDNVEIQVQLAELLRKRNPTVRGQAEVMFLYDRILRTDPDRHSVRREALDTCLKLGRYSDAATHAEFLLEKFPTESMLWRQLATAQTGLHQLTEARASYETAIRHAPEEIAHYQRLAQLIWRSQNDPAGAREVLDRMIKAIPQSPEARLIRARFEILLADEPGDTGADLKRAADDLTRVFEHDPENAEASLMLADLYQRDRKVSSAHAVLRDAAALYPHDLRLIRSLSWLELIRGNAPAAIAVLEDGLRATPDAFDLLVPLADLLVQQGDTTRTAAILQQLEARKAPPLQVKYLQARVTMRDRKWNEAVQLLESLRAEVTNLPGLELQLNQLLAVCFGQLGDAGSEEKAYQRVINADPKSVQGHLGMGHLLLSQARFDDAVRELELAAQSPYAAGAVVSEWIRTKIHRLRVTNAPADEWRRLEQAIHAAAGRFGPVSSEPLILVAELGLAVGKGDEVIQLLRKETASRPGDTRLWAVLAQAVADVQGTYAALGVVDEAQAAAGDNPDVRLVRARLYANEPGRLRPIGGLGERIDSWPEAEQQRLLYGLVEVFDHIGDQPNVVRTLRKIAGRRPSDAGIWMRLHERAILIGDSRAAAEARSMLVKLEGEAGTSVLLCDAAVAQAADSPRMIEQMIGRFGPNPVRADACLALARLYRQSGNDPREAELIERAFLLEPTRFEAAHAWLKHLAGMGAEERVRQLIVRLGEDPRWYGEPFRHLVSSALPGIPASSSARILSMVRPFVEREPGGLGWLAETAAASKVMDVVPMLLDATQRQGATPDDWLRLAIQRDGEDLTRSREKLVPGAYLAAAALYCATPAGKAFEPVLRNASERRLFIQAQLALHLSRDRTADATHVMEQYLESTDLAPADRAWARRNLAMLHAVGGTPEDRTRAMDLIKDVADGGTSPEELRATASVLTTLARYLEGKDRITILVRAATALDAAYKKANSPKDLFNLAQLYRAFGNRAEGRKCLQILLNNDPKNLYYLVAALDELVEDQDYQSARGFADKLLAAHPGEFRAISAVARYECQAGRPNEALLTAERYAHAADPAAGDHLTRSARVAELMDELSRLPRIRGTPTARAMADAGAERFAALIPSRPEAVVGLVGILAADGRTDEAFARLERLGRGIPSRARAAAGLAALRSGTVTETQAAAIRDWIEECLAEEPTSTTLLLNKAEYLTLRGQLPAAIAQYEQILAREPRNVVTLNNLAWLQAADPATAEKAMELVARATREVGLTGDLLDTRARVRITLKQFAEAEHDLGDAIRLESTALRWFHLALSRLGQNPPKTEDAARAFTEAKRRGLSPHSIHPADAAMYRTLEARYAEKK
jgi:tetratricopeptide (TPR) repeat protein